MSEGYYDNDDDIKEGTRCMVNVDGGVTGDNGPVTVIARAKRWTDGKQLGKSFTAYQYPSGSVCHNKTCSLRPLTKEEEKKWPREVEYYRSPREGSKDWPIGLSANVGYRIVGDKVAVRSIVGDGKWYGAGQRRKPEHVRKYCCRVGTEYEAIHGKKEEGEEDEKPKLRWFRWGGVLRTFSDGSEDGFKIDVAIPQWVATTCTLSFCEEHLENEELSDDEARAYLKDKGWPLPPGMDEKKDEVEEIVGEEGDEVVGESEDVVLAEKITKMAFANIEVREMKTTRYWIDDYKTRHWRLKNGKVERIESNGEVDRAFNTLKDMEVWTEDGFGGHREVGEAEAIAWVSAREQDDSARKETRTMNKMKIYRTKKALRECPECTETNLVLTRGSGKLEGKLVMHCSRCGHDYIVDKRRHPIKRTLKVAGFGYTVLRFLNDKAPRKLAGFIGLMTGLGLALRYPVPAQHGFDFVWDNGTAIAMFVVNTIGNGWTGLMTMIG